MRRIMLYDRLGNPLGELAEADVFEAILREEINGEHSLEITTTRVLDKGIRMLYQDGRSKWREFVVAGVDAEHASGNRAIGTYYCVWSVQQDLQGVTVSVMPGVQVPTTAALALDALLSTTARWTRGTVTQITTSGASMYDRSAWEALSVLVDVWGGEVDATITVDTQSGVTGRTVDLYAAQGEQTAMRRFDFGADLMSVKRTLADNPLFCRISPRGKGEETDAGGYGRKITIESVNDGKDWLEYAPMVDAAKLPDGNGGYEYPTLIVENSDCETPSDLKAWGESVLAQYCTPEITYEIDVLQAGAEGVDVTGVSLGDTVQVVDRKFSDEGIRVQGRVRSITTDLLNERDITIIIGDEQQSISSKFASVDKSLATVNNDLTVMSTATYIDNLLGRINAEINATGGYTYIVPGHGIMTFDVAVADPLNPVEASQVVEIKGGSIRIANSRTAQGEWEWKSVFTSGHISADLVTAAKITAGYIGSSGGTFIDLDNNTVNLGDTSKAHLTISNTEVTMNNSSLPILDFVGEAQRFGQDVYNGVYYTFGSRAPLTGSDANQGLYSLTVGTENYAAGYSYYSATLGRGLYATGEMTSLGPGTGNGLAIGRYNVYTTYSGHRYAYADLLHSTHIGDDKASKLLFVIGNGSSDTNRKNIAEINQQGDMAISGKLYASNIGRYYTTGFKTVDNSSGPNYVTIASVDINDGTYGYGVYIAFAEVYLNGNNPGNSNAAIDLNFGTTTSGSSEFARITKKTTDRVTMCGVAKIRTYSSSMYINLESCFIYQPIVGKLTVIRVA